MRTDHTNNSGIDIYQRTPIEYYIALHMKYIAAFFDSKNGVLDAKGNYIAVNSSQKRSQILNYVDTEYYFIQIIKKNNLDISIYILERNRLIHYSDLEILRLYEEFKQSGELYNQISLMINS